VIQEDVPTTVVEDGNQDQSLESQEIETHLAEKHEPSIQHFFVAFDPADPDVPDEMVSFNVDVKATDSMTAFLTLPTVTPRVSTNE